MSFKSQNHFFAIPILLLASCKQLISSVIIAQRYQHRFTCSNTVLSDLMLIFGPEHFSITIALVFIAINSMPYFIQVSLTLSTHLCNPSSGQAINTVSSANLMLLIVVPLMSRPGSSWILQASSNSSSLYVLKNIGERTQPYTLLNFKTTGDP